MIGSKFFSGSKAIPDDQPGEENSNKEKMKPDESLRALSVLFKFFLIGLVSIIIYSFQTSTPSQIFNFATIGVMVAIASFLSGGLLGFLFGIPRTLQKDPPQSNKENTLTATDEQSVNYAPNTNLEQISDWLTKILVGVGLTQIGTIPEKLQQMAAYVSPGIGKSESSNIFSLAIIVCFGICGFLFGYLWTRLFLLGAIKKADISALAIQLENTGKEIKKAKEDVKQVNQKLQELEEQSKIDTTALSLVHRQLNPSIDIPPVGKDELINAITPASRPLKVQIFTLAHNVRQENWKTNKKKMALSIPVFRALIAGDSNGEYHRNHAQLGYALKDQENPDWRQAEIELSEAINRRGPWRDNGWLFYEFNRAICRIHLSKQLSEQTAKEEARKKINEDLLAVFNNRDLKKLILTDDAVLNWINENPIDKK